MITHSGLLISFEGGEGAGKTIQTKRLRDRLVAAKQDVVVLREPGGTVISEQIRDVVLSAKNVGIAYTTEVLLFQAARAQLYREIVLPSLKAGKMVVMDRTRDSSVVYQGIVRKFGQDLIEQLNTISTHDTYPDLTILLDVSVKTGLERRMKSGKMDRLDMENRQFHEAVREAYMSLAQADTTGRWVIINADQPLEKVEAEIWQAVSKKLKVLPTV